MTPIFAPRQWLLQVMDRKSKCRADRKSMSDPNKLHPCNDAKTGLALHFSSTETTQAYMETLISSLTSMVAQLP